MKKKIFISAIVLLVSLLIIKKTLNKLDEKSQQRLNYSSTQNNSIYGIDISHHQGVINWKQVDNWQNKKISFIYIKATEGSTYIDKTYRNNLNQAIKNNFLVGSYHYFRTTSPIESQFQNFKNNVQKSKQDLIPLIDVEENKNWSNDIFHENFQKFLNMVEEYYGKKPIIYTVNSFYNLHLSGKYKKYHFLIGRYGKNPPNMRDKSNWTIWQFTETGKIKGISKTVDINILNDKYKLSDILLD